jgi:hypothetical protein
MGGTFEIRRAAAHPSESTARPPTAVIPSLLAAGAAR